MELEDYNDFSNEVLERQLLKYITVKDYSLAPELNPDIFAGESERKIFNILTKKLQSNFPAKTVPDMVLQHVRGSDAEFDAMAEAVDRVLRADNLNNYGAARAVVKSLQHIQSQRVLARASDTIREAALEGDVETGYKALRLALSANPSRVEMGEYIEDYSMRASKIDERMKRKKTVKDIVPTGVIQFDRVAGGLKKGEVGVIAGATGVGKSMTKLNFAAAAWLQGFNVVFYGLEMSSEENEFRLDTLLTEIPTQAFRLANLTKEDRAYWNKLMIELKKERAKNYLMFVGARGQSMPDILSTVEGIEQRRGRLDLLILDHILLVKREYPRELNLKIWENFDELSDWSKDHFIATWTSSQVTDEAQKQSRKGGMRANAVKYGRAVSEIAQVVVSIWQNDQDEAIDDMNMQIVKGRNIKRPPPFKLRMNMEKMVLDRVSFCMLGLDKYRKLRGKKKSGSLV